MNYFRLGNSNRSSPLKGKSSSIAAVFNLAATGMVLIFLFMKYMGASLTTENGLLENSQVAALLLAVYVFARQIAYLSRRDSGQAGKVRISYCYVMICMPLIGTARELGFGKEIGAAPEMVTLIMTSIGFIALFLMSLGVAIWIEHIEHRWRMIWSLLVGKSSRSIYLSIIVFTCAGAFEKGALGFPYSAFLEELFELIAYFLIARAALLISPVRLNS